MNQPLISVIIPVYGVEKYISQCLESVINQTYKIWRSLSLMMVQRIEVQILPRSMLRKTVESKYMTFKMVVLA